MNNDIKIIRELTNKYAEIAKKPIQNERRKLWSAQNSLKATRPLIFIENFGSWISWCRDEFNDEKLRCDDMFYKNIERDLKIKIFMDSFGDDKVLEPWITVGAVLKTNHDGLWGVPFKKQKSQEKDGAFKEIHPLDDWDKLKNLRIPHHEIDEDATQSKYNKINDVIGDIIEIDLDRGPELRAHGASIAEPLGAMRGIEPLMMDMYDSPKQLHELLTFLRDATLINHQEAEDAGDWSLTSNHNQSMTYSEELENPKANCRNKKRNEIWGYCQAQEYELISPEFHDEFMLQYQIPIMEKFGLMAYGCCEKLENKINILRRIHNLRMIAVSPTANIAKCAEQIGNEYVISWRPNPADMVCCGFNETKIKKIIKNALAIFKANDCRIHINLKDVQTLEGDITRLAKWTKIVREVIGSVGSVGSVGECKST